MRLEAIEKRFSGFTGACVLATFLLVLFSCALPVYAEPTLPEGIERFDGKYNLAFEIELTPNELQYLVDYFDWSSFSRRFGNRRWDHNISPFLEEVADTYLTHQTLATLPKDLQDHLTAGLDMTPVQLVDPTAEVVQPKSPVLELPGKSASTGFGLLGSDGKPLSTVPKIGVGSSVSQLSLPPKAPVVLQFGSAPAPAFLLKRNPLDVMRDRWRAIPVNNRIGLMEFDHLPRLTKATVGLLMMTPTQDTPSVVEVGVKESAPEPFKRLLKKLVWHRQNSHFEIKSKEPTQSPKEYLQDLHLLASYIPGMWRRLSEPGSGRKVVSYHLNFSPVVPADSSYMPMALAYSRRLAVDRAVSGRSESLRWGMIPELGIPNQVAFVEDLAGGVRAIQQKYQVRQRSRGWLEQRTHVVDPVAETFELIDLYELPIADAAHLLNVQTQARLTADVVERLAAIDFLSFVLLVENSFVGAGEAGRVSLDHPWVLAQIPKLIARDTAWMTLPMNAAYAHILSRRPAFTQALLAHVLKHPEPMLADQKSRLTSLASWARISPTAKAELTRALVEEPPELMNRALTYLLKEIIDQEILSDPRVLARLRGWHKEVPDGAATQLKVFCLSKAFLPVSPSERAEVFRQALPLVKEDVAIHALMQLDELIAHEPEAARELLPILFSGLVPGREVPLLENGLRAVVTNLSTLDPALIRKARAHGLSFVSQDSERLLPLVHAIETHLGEPLTGKASANPKPPPERRCRFWF